jgi:REP-associated tyrosine transposase
MAEPLESLEPDRYYHIYNHAVGVENLFRSDKNYILFLEGLKKHIYPVADLFCYCLMKNHFHFVVRFRSHDEIAQLMNKMDLKLNLNKIIIRSSEEVVLFLSQQFSNYFNSYARVLNKENFRRGALFERAFHRKNVMTEDYLRKLIRYIHQNPVNDGFTNRMEAWKYSSYNSIVSISPSLVARRDVLELFGDLENFIYYHKENSEGFEY